MKLGWTVQVHGTTPIDLRKRQLLDMMQFLSVPGEVQDKVKSLIADWSKPEDFDSGIPVIRAILQGKMVKAKDVETALPNYSVRLEEDKAFIGTQPWIQKQQPKQKIVDMEEVEDLLKEGWKFVSSLPNGRCVVER